MIAYKTTIQQNNYMLLYNNYQNHIILYTIKILLITNILWFTAVSLLIVFHALIQDFQFNVWDWFIDSLLVFNANFSTIGYISWQSVFLLVEKTGIHEENHSPPLRPCTRPPMPLLFRSF